MEIRNLLMPSAPNNTRMWEVLLLVIAMLEAITAGFVGWTFNSVQDTRERVVRLETKMEMLQPRGSVASTGSVASGSIPPKSIQ